MSTSFHTPVAFGAAVNSSVVNAPLGQLDQAIINLNSSLGGLLAGSTAFTQLSLGTYQDSTLATGAFTVSKSRHRLDTEGAAATDDLDNINGASNGDWLRIQITNNARVIVVRHNGGGAGNIRTPDGNNITLSNVNSFLDLLYDGPSGVWIAQVPTASATVNARDLITSTLATWGTLNFPRGGVASSGPGTGTNQVYANMWPSFYRRITRHAIGGAGVLYTFGMAGAFTTPGAGAAENVASGGVYVTLQTTAAINSRAGLEGGASTATQRRFYPVLMAKIGPMDSSTSVEYLVCLVNALINSSTTLNGFGFRWLGGTDTNWMGIVRDGVTLQTVDTGVPRSTTAGFEFMAWIDDAGATAYFSVNGSTPVSINANLPGATTNLFPQCTVTSTSAVGNKGINFNRFAVEADG